MAVDDRNNLQREGWDARDALFARIPDATERIRKSVEAAKINARCSQSSGDVEGGCVSNFLKRAFIKGHCIN
jgi:hypothetical protein